jgi:alkylation response protein AidB-like acyl-CoA dehydrogenase
VSVQALAVPAAWVVPEAEMLEAFRRRAAMPGVRVVPVPAVVSLGTVAPVIGMTRAALNGYEQLLLARSESRNVLPAALERLARMRAQMKALDLLYRDSVQLLDARIDGKTLSDTAISTLQMHAAWIVRSCREMASELLVSCGTKGVSSGNVLQRHVTGILTLSTHYLVDYDGVSINHGAKLLQQGSNGGKAL